MKKVLMLIGRMLSCVYTTSLSFKISLIRSFIYTGWHKRDFKKMEGFLNYPSRFGGTHNISIGKGTIVGKNSLITAWTNYKEQGYSKFEPSIIIGNNCHIGEYAHISAIQKIEIGDDVLLGRNVLIIDHDHGDGECLSIAPKQRPLKSKGSITIEDKVWIGDKVTVLSGVTIGAGAVVGANAVVTKNVAPYTIVGGIPAKKLK